MTRDILKELRDGVVSLDEVERIYDSIMASENPDVPGRLGLSNVEYTAHGHGAWFDDLCRWRYEGWPTVCPSCGKTIAPSEFGWMVREHEGALALFHIGTGCLPSYEDQDP